METKSKAAAWLLCLAVLVIFGGAVGAADAAADKDALALTALCGAAGRQHHDQHAGPDQRRRVPRNPRQADRTRGLGGPQRVLNLNDVPAEDGSATVTVDPLERGTEVIVQAHVRDRLRRDGDPSGYDDSEAPPGPRRRGRARAAPNALDAPGRRRRGRGRVEHGRRRHGDGDAHARADAPRRRRVGDRRAWRDDGRDLRRRCAGDADDGRADRPDRGSGAVRDRRDEQLPPALDRGDRARARPRQRSGRRAGRLRRAVQPARLRAGDERAGGDAAGHGGEGEALEPQLVRIFYNDDFEEQPNRVRNTASFIDIQLARGRRDDQHHLSGRQHRQDEACRVDDDVRLDPRAARRGGGLHQRPLGDGRERGRTRRR